MNIVFSFDDGRVDSYDAYRLLKKYNLVASFHITTGFIDGTFKTDAFGENRQPLSIEQIKEMISNGMDVSSHGDKHIMNSEDFRASLIKLRSYGVSSLKIGFSVPNSRFNPEELKNFVDDNNDNLLYVRVGRSKKCYSLFSKANYFLYHVFHWQVFFNFFNKNNLLFSVNKHEINSLVMLNDSNCKNLIKFIRKYQNTAATLVLMFHSIVDEPKNKWEYSKKQFESICKFVSKNTNIKTLATL